MRWLGWVNAEHTTTQEAMCFMLDYMNVDFYDEDVTMSFILAQLCVKMNLIYILKI